MSTFRVTIKGGRNEVEYTVLENAHDNTAVRAAQEALDTYARHGHAKFPYNHGSLSVEVEEVRADLVTSGAAPRERQGHADA